MMKKSLFSVKNMTLSAVLVALALILSLVERWIPLFIPVPGIRLGLANIVTVFALYAMGPLPSLVVLLVRCVLGAMFAGTFTSLAFSLCGGILAFLVMWLLSQSRHISPLGVCVGGAAAHNVGQILAAMVLLSSKAPLAYLPVLLIVAVVTGIITGVISALVMGAVNGVSYIADSVAASRQTTGSLPTVDVQLESGEEEDAEPDMSADIAAQPMPNGGEPSDGEGKEQELFGENSAGETFEQIMERLKKEKNE